MTFTRIAAVLTAAVALAGLTTGSAAAAEASAARACTITAGAPTHNSGNITAAVSTSGCTVAIQFTARLQWRNLTGVAWTNLDTAVWRGNKSLSLFFDCKGGETETYRVVVDSTSGGHRQSAAKRITCGV